MSLRVWLGVLVAVAAVTAGYVTAPPPPGMTGKLEAGSVSGSSGGRGPGGTAVAGHLNVVHGFDVRDSHIGVAARDAPATGTIDEPVAITKTATRATTALARDHWTLEALLVVTQALPASVFEVDLEWNGAPCGDVVVREDSNSSVGDSVAMTFDIGPDLDPSSSYVLTVSRLNLSAASAVTSAEIHLASADDGTPKWHVDGADASTPNPTLTAAAGAPLKLTWRNGDGGFHNLVVRDASGAKVVGPTRNLDTKGDTASLDWPSPTPGTFTYACVYHAGTMSGKLVVT